MVLTYLRKKNKPSSYPQFRQLMPQIQLKATHSQPTSSHQEKSSALTDLQGQSLHCTHQGLGKEVRDAEQKF